MKDQYQDNPKTVTLFRLTIHIIFTVTIGSIIFVVLEQKLQKMEWLVDYSNMSSSVLGIACSAASLIFRRVLEIFYPLIPEP